MKFNPCADKCTKDGSHCKGCGRSHEEIASIKQLVMNAAEFAIKMDYDNPGEFANALAKSTRSKIETYKRLKKFSDSSG